MANTNDDLSSQLARLREEMNDRFNILEHTYVTRSQLDAKLEVVPITVLRNVTKLMQTMVQDAMKEAMTEFVSTYMVSPEAKQEFVRWLEEQRDAEAEAREEAREQTIAAVRNTLRGAGRSIGWMRDIALAVIGLIAIISMLLK